MLNRFLIALVCVTCCAWFPANPAFAQCEGHGNATLLLKRSCEVGASLKLRVAGPSGAKYRVWSDLGAGPTEIPGVGTFCLDFGPDLETVGTGNLNGAGRAAVFTTIPDDPGLVGSVFAVQFAVKDGEAPNGVAISNGYKFEICGEGDNGDCDGRIGCLDYITVLEYAGDYPTTIDTRVYKTGDESKLLGFQAFSYDPDNKPTFPIGNLEDGIIVRRITQSGDFLLIHTTATAFGVDGADGDFESNSTFETTVGDVTVLQDIHTSCSDPIGPGFRFGPIFITGLTNDATCVPNLCDDGKPCSLLLRYTGDSCDATQHGQDDGKVNCAGDPMMEPLVVIRASDNEDHEDTGALVWFEGEVELGDQFRIEALPAGENRFKSATFIHIFSLGGDLLQAIEFHTSCSQPLNVGNQFGAIGLDGFTIEGDCEDLNPNQDLCDGVKPQVIWMKYTGDDCSVTDHSQDDSKVQCEGDPAFAAQVHIRASDDEDPNDTGALVWFDGVVDLDGFFDINAVTGGETRLKTETFVHIFDLDENLLQMVEFHTSCSQPLRQGDRFGAIKLKQFIAE